MGVESKLIVDVDELKTTSAKINTVCVDIDEAMDSLIDNLQYVCKSGLMSGQASNDFIVFTEEISQLKGTIKSSGKLIKSSIINFLLAIDIADDLLFKNQGYKPFTDEEFKACFAVVENTAAPSLNRDRTYGWFSDLFNKIMKMIWELADIEVTIGNDESVLRTRVENLKEQTVEKICTIKNGVRMEDRLYRQKINNQIDVFEKYKQSLKQIYSIVSIPSGEINTNDVVHLKNLNAQRRSIEISPENINDESVKYFADNVSDYFDSSTAVIDIICTNSLAQMVTGDYDVYRATVRSALEYFNSYSDNYVESSTRYNEYKSDFDEMLELYNKYGSKWVSNYEGSKERAEMFNKIVKKTSEISEKSEDYTDVWFQLFCDMSDSKDAFIRFKSNCDLSDKEVQKALERVEDLYNNRVDAFVFETLEHIALELKNKTIAKGVQAATEAYAKCVPGGGLEQIMSKVTSTILDRAFTEAPAVTQYDWVVATQNSFDNALIKLKNANPGSEGYDELVKMVRESFDTAKQARVKFFTTMVNNSTGQEQRFYQLNLESVKTMSLKDQSAHKAINPGEFYGENHSVFGYLLEGDIQVNY